MRRYLPLLASLVVVIGVGLFVYHFTGLELSGGLSGGVRTPRSEPVPYLDGGWNHSDRIAMSVTAAVVTAGLLGLRYSKPGR